MKNLKGGYVILDLMAIALAVTSEPVTITDEGIKKQLLSLYPYLGDNQRDLKPIYLRARDEDYGDAVVLASITRADSLKINAKIFNGSLLIDVSYAVDASTGEVSVYSATYELISEAGDVEEVVIDTLKDLSEGEVSALIGLDEDGEPVKETIANGTIAELLGLNDDGEIVKKTVASGIIVDVLGLDSEGNLVKGSVSGGTQLYKHHIQITNGAITLINTSSTPISTSITKQQLFEEINSALIANVGKGDSGINASFAKTARHPGSFSTFNCICGFVAGNGPTSLDNAGVNLVDTTSVTFTVISDTVTAL